MAGEENEGCRVLRLRRAGVGLLTLGALLWGGTMFVLADQQGARADSPVTVRDEDLLLLVTGADGDDYYVSISMLIGDTGQGNYEEDVLLARADMAARFPGAVVVEEAESEEVIGEYGKAVHQYVTNDVWWEAHGASWKYNSAGSPGVPGESGAISAGADTWALSGAVFSFSYSGSSSAGASGCNGGTDDANVVTWAPLSGSTLGVTCTWFSTSGSPRPLIEFDMELDPDWGWTTSTSDIGTDLQSVATHEFGHALGLGHSSTKQAVMYFSYSSGSLKRTLQADDINGIISIYGGSAPEPTATSTSTKTPTPAKTATPPAGEQGGTSDTPFPLPTATKSATPTGTPGGEPTLALKPGANLLTWPGKTTGPIEALANESAITMVYEWDATTRTWKRYAPNVPAYVNNLSTLAQGKAYWFLTTGAASISYSE